MIDGMLGSMPTRSLAETENPGIQLIIEQADQHQRPLTMRTDGYIMGWGTIDLLIEIYIQTGNRVGFDHITGAEIKNTLENIIDSPLSDVERIGYIMAGHAAPWLRITSGRCIIWVRPAERLRAPIARQC